MLCRVSCIVFPKNVFNLKFNMRNKKYAELFPPTLSSDHSKKKLNPAFVVTKKTLQFLVSRPVTEPKISHPKIIVTVWSIMTFLNLSHNFYFLLFNVKFENILTWLIQS